MALSDLLARFRQSDSEYDEDYQEDSYDTSSSAVTQAEAEAPRFTAPKTTEKVLNMQRSPLQNASVKIVQPTKYTDIMKEPVTFLRENKSVVLNLEKVTSVEARKRIVDFMAGVVAAIDGRIVRVAECTYYIVPSTVDISGDMLEQEEQF
ncbi:MAG: cell division protein SepF [Oscillospiraceae bacterium]|nr:cell division protein SepF [Oscillospiraceae bacterium]